MGSSFWEAPEGLLGSSWEAPGELPGNSWELLVSSWEAPGEFCLQGFALRCTAPLAVKMFGDSLGLLKRLSGLGLKVDASCNGFMAVSRVAQQGAVPGCSMPNMS